MPKFTWEGKTRTGKVQKGVMEASSEEAVNNQLRGQGIMPTSVKAPGKGMSAELNFAFMQPKIVQKDIVIFTRQFATMIDAGLPLVQCLDILSRQQENKTFRKVLHEVKESVESGSTFADALKKHPKVFDNLFVNLIAAGEVGGILDTILNRLAAYIEKSMKLKKQVKSAMTYPVTIVGVAFCVITVILVFVIPQFQSMFESFGGTLPTPTLIVVAISEFIQAYAIHILVGMFVFKFSYKKFGDTTRGREILDALYLKLPVFGTLIRKVAVAKFTRTLGTMISSGVPILEGLDIVARTAGNKTIEKAIFKVAQSISEGKTIAEPLEKSGVFPSMVCQMIAVGEQAGALDTMLNKIADFYDDEVDDAVGNLTAMMEPLLMAFLGVTVGGLVVAMYLPIFQLAGSGG
jgi:type IV pilus assembly protein PilC